MAKGYRPVDRDQGFLLPPDMREWLPVDDPVWVLIEVIEKHLDTSAFHRLRRRGGAGRAGYDPDMLLTLLVWGWMQQVTSSRRLERLCSRDVGFRVICAGDVPDHVTIARFRAEFADAVEGLFAEVLVLCARLGLGRVELVGVDGTKIAAPASRWANRTEDGLRRAQQAVEREAAVRAARAANRAHADADAAEDAAWGAGRGDGLEEDRGPGAGRSARIAAALAELQAEREQQERERAERERGWAERAAAHGGLAPGRPLRGTEVAVAGQALDRARAEVAQRLQRWQATGRGRHPCPEGVEQSAAVRAATARLERARAVAARREARQAGRSPARGRMRNITDPQSRPQPLPGGGWLQGYNAQVAVSADGIVLATSVSNNTADSPAFLPLVAAAAGAAEQMGVGPIGTVVADAGYLTIANLTGPGPDRLIAVGKHRDVERAAREPEPTQPTRPGATVEVEAMRARLKTPEAMAAYRQRGQITETIFGHGKHNWRFTRFTGRGLQRARTEWTFHAAVHNLAKIIHRAAGQPGWQPG